MLIDRYQQMNLFETVVPTCVGRMDPELQEIDHLLENDTLLQDSVRVLSRMANKVSAVAAGVRARDFTRSAKRQALNILKFTP